MTSRDDYVEVVMASDQGYLPGLLGTAASIALFSSRDVTLSFTFLDGGIADESYDFVVERVKALHPHVEVRRFMIDDGIFVNFPSWRGNKMTYARFLIPSLLPDAGHAIYCDVDFLFLADIAELWRMRDDNVILKACHDPQISETDEKDDMQRQGLPYCEEKYFNAGLVMMNLRVFREQKIVDQVYELLGKYHFRFLDQGAMNVLFHDKAEIIDNKWMRFTRYSRAGDLEKPIAWHFVNEAPWKKLGWVIDFTDTRMAWLRVMSLARGESFLRTIWRYNTGIQMAAIAFWTVIAKFPVFRQLFMLALKMARKQESIEFFTHRASLLKVPVLKNAYR